MSDNLNKLKTMLEDIRTQMSAIVGMSGLITRDDIPPAVYDYVQNVKQSGTDFLSATGGILDFSKIKSGEVEIESAEYLTSELIDEVTGVILERITGKPLRFTVNADSNIPKMLIGDAVRLKQVLLDLLINAFDRLSEGWVSMALDSAIDGDSVKLQIKISDSSTGEKGDITIAENLCKAMGGNASALDGVLTATIPQRFRTHEKLAVVDKAAVKNVLLYEPRLIYANSLAYTIENLGAQCTSVDQQAEFYDELNSSKYSYVFMPVFMLDTTKLIVNERGLDAELVLLTEYGEELSEQDVKIIAMPAYSVQIAKILNN